MSELADMSERPARGTAPCRKISGGSSRTRTCTCGHDCPWGQIGTTLVDSLCEGHARSQASAQLIDILRIHCTKLAMTTPKLFCSILGLATLSRPKEIEGCMGAGTMERHQRSIRAQYGGRRTQGRGCGEGKR